MIYDATATMVFFKWLEDGKRDYGVTSVKISAEGRDTIEGLLRGFFSPTAPDHAPVPNACGRVNGVEFYEEQTS